jgi:hypothetical protein
MKISDDGMPQPNATNAFGFAHLLSAQDFAQRGPPEIVVGQVLYLEAEETGIRSTGIGCYVDDPVHEAFGIKSRQWQSFYHFNVGGQVEDTRLTTLPSYDFEEER